MKESEVRSRAFAMPLTNPAYPIGPYRFYNREYLITPIQIRSATVQHRRHGGVNGRERVGVKGFSRRRRCERSEHP
jgi:hypothetical protein